MNVGFALCGSFCTFEKAFAAMAAVKERFGEVTPIFSFNAAGTDTRFGTAADHLARAREISGKEPILTLAQAEPIGPKKLLDALVICPCTGNTLAKLAAGIADTPVTLAAKSHLRNGRPLVLAVSTNDGLGANAASIGRLLSRRYVTFVPFGQDDPSGKPASLVADFGRVPAAVAAALEGRQLQPLLL